MGKSNFVIADGAARLVANDVSDFHYKAAIQRLMPEEQTAARCNEIAATEIMVSEGTLEVMIDGATAYATAGDFMRVAKGSTYSLRNTGNMFATVLVRTVSPEGHRRALRVVADCAA